MTPLEAARAMDATQISMHCDYCTGSPVSGHFDVCPMLQMPAIVAALEAADAVRVELVGLSGEMRPYHRGADGQASLYHLYDETVTEFVAALKGVPPD
jgi:hypothetical protein